MKKKKNCLKKRTLRAILSNKPSFFFCKILLYHLSSPNFFFGSASGCGFVPESTGFAALVHLVVLTFAIFKVCAILRARSSDVQTSLLHTATRLQPGYLELKLHSFYFCY